MQVANSFTASSSATPDTTGASPSPAAPPSTDGLTMDSFLADPAMRDLFAYSIVSVNIGVNNMLVDMLRRVLDEEQ